MTFFGGLPSRCSSARVQAERDNVDNHPPESGGPVDPGKALPTHEQRRLGVWHPGALPVLKKLNLHALVELVDRHNPKARPEALRVASSPTRIGSIAISRLTAGSRTNTSCSADRNPILGTFTPHRLRPIFRTRPHPLCRL